MANVSSFSGAMPVIPGGEVEVARVTRTSGDYTVNQTTIANAANIFSSNLTWVADGGSYIVEFYSPAVGSATGANSTTVVSLVTSAGTDLGIIGQSGLGDGSRDRRAPMLTRFWYTPSAGSVSINARAIYWNSGNGFIAGGAGGAGTNMPAYLRVVKPVNQNDGLKPFWTPPVVTSLPSQATEGDQVLLYSSSPYAGYQTHQYASGSWNALSDSRMTGAWQSWTPTYTNVTVGNGTRSGAYVVFGKTCHCWSSFTLGSTSSFSGTPVITLPLASKATASGIFQGFFMDIGVAYYTLFPRPGSTTTVELYAEATNGTYGQATSSSATIPFTWGTGDILYFGATYEIA